MYFADALRRFTHLLAETRWPEPIVWVEPGDVIEFPTLAAFVYRRSKPLAAADVRAVFEANYAVAPAVHFHGVGHANGQTFAFVRAIAELGQGEQMFVADGLKLSVSACPPRVVVVKSRLYWWWIDRRYRAWETKRDRALRVA